MSRQPLPMPAPGYTPPEAGRSRVHGAKCALAGAVWISQLSLPAPAPAQHWELLPTRLSVCLS